jgi:REP element-mobilizing transposase RayT
MRLARDINRRDSESRSYSLRALAQNYSRRSRRRGEEAKKRSSKWIKTRGEAFRHFQWQTGYGAFSIGQSNIEGLRKYIAGQKEHHRRRTFEEEYRAFLGKYGVAYDEKYVWD